MQDVHNLISRFNETIDVLIASLERYSLENLRRQPQAGRWSLGQMYTHIADDTTYFIEQMKAALATPGNSHESMHEDAKAMFARNAFPDIKIEGPATNTFIPQPDNKDGLKNRLVAIKQIINELFNNIDESNLRGKTAHPGLHYFTALEWLQFAEMHMRHHFRQKERIEIALGI